MEILELMEKHRDGIEKYRELVKEVVREVTGSNDEKEFMKKIMEDFDESVPTKEVLHNLEQDLADEDFVRNLKRRVKNDITYIWKCWQRWNAIKWQ